MRYTFLLPVSYLPSRLRVSVSLGVDKPTGAKRASGCWLPGPHGLWSSRWFCWFLGFGARVLVVGYRSYIGGLSDVCLSRGYGVPAHKCWVQGFPAKCSLFPLFSSSISSAP